MTDTVTYPAGHVQYASQICPPHELFVNLLTTAQTRYGLFLTAMEGFTLVQMKQKLLVSCIG